MVAYGSGIQPNIPQSGMIQLPRTRRGTRVPVHTWRVKHPAFCLQPIVIAPVWPGETLKQARIQYRCVTDPIANRLGGWWKEHFFFYVPWSAMDAENYGGGTLKEMMIEPEHPGIAYNPTRTDVNYMNDDGVVQSYDWLQLIQQVVVDRWFRSEGETQNLAAGWFGAGQPPGNDRWYKVRAEAPGWADSYGDDSEETDPDITLVDEAGSGTLTASELETAMRQWQLQRYQGLTAMTWEEFLQTYRVSVPTEPGIAEVELLRYSRDWAYPSNTVVPTTGAVTTAVSWAKRFSINKRRFFREPGFIVGFSVVRAKVFFAKQTSYAASQMYTAMSWLPATLWQELRLGVTSIATDQMIKDAGAAQFDVRDLAMYGDQFLGNISAAATNQSLVNLPDTDKNTKYIADADIKALFVDTTTNYLIEEDGRCDLAIASSIKDFTPGTVGAL